MQLVGISKWLAECAEQSDVFRKFNIRMIHNNINTKVFFPVDRQISRAVLGLPKEKKVVLVGAAGQHMKHKGFESGDDEREDHQSQRRAYRIRL